MPPSAGVGAIIDEIFSERVEHHLVQPTFITDYPIEMSPLGALSRGAPERWVLNVDIDGGTTNLALGRAGEVVATGWLWVGARDVEVEPGGYRVAGCSPEAGGTMRRLGIARRAGEVLAPRELELVVGAWVEILEGAVAGQVPPWASELAPAPLALTAGWEIEADPVRGRRAPGPRGAAIDLAFSGGVGGLVYDALAGRPLPPPTAYGDLGIDLAERAARSPALGGRALVPPGRGRATVYGLLRHQTQLSGATLMALVLAILRTLLDEGLEPGALVSRLNQQIARHAPPSRFITLLFGIYDPASGQFQLTTKE